MKKLFLKLFGTTKSAISVPKQPIVSNANGRVPVMMQTHPGFFPRLFGAKSKTIEVTGPVAVWTKEPRTTP